MKFIFFFFLFAAFRSCISAQDSDFFSPISIMPIIGGNFTLLQLSITQFPLVITSHNIPIYKICYKKNPEIPRLPNDIYNYDPILKDTTIPLFLLHDFEGKSLEIYIVTHFAFDTEIRLTIANSTTSMKYFLAQNLTDLIPLDYYSRVRITSVEQGREFYPIMNDKHVERNLSLYPGISPLDQIPFMTFQRSGTHVYVRTLGDVLGEFVHCNQKSTLNNDTYDNLNGEIRWNFNNTRILVSHIIPSNRINNKILISVRNFLDAIDSEFHRTLVKLILEEKCQTNVKVKPGYEKLTQFNEYVIKQSDLFLIQLNYARSFGIPVFYTRFEDLLEFPEETLCQIISFIEGVPCHLLESYSKFKTHLNTYGLSSNYLKKKSGKKPINKSKENKSMGILSSVNY